MSAFLRKYRVRIGGTESVCYWYPVLTLVARFPALPALLAHAGAIQFPAMVMSIFGGLLIYGTIISFTMFFREQEEF